MELNRALLKMTYQKGKYCIMPDILQHMQFSLFFCSFLYTYMRVLFLIPLTAGKKKDGDIPNRWNIGITERNVEVSVGQCDLHKPFKKS